MATPAATAAFYVMPALIMGLIIGLVELFFVSQDEAGMGWLGHGLHAIPTMIFFIFASMNVGWVLSFFGTTEAKIGTIGVIGIRAAIALIAAFKIGAAAAIAGRVGEKLHHSLIIGVLVAAAPYIWMFGVQHALMPFWPWKTGFFRL